MSSGLASTQTVDSGAPPDAAVTLPVIPPPVSKEALAEAGDPPATTVTGVAFADVALLWNHWLR